jgi:hypothetical protein
LGKTDGDPFDMELLVLHRQGLAKPEITVLNVLDQRAWEEMLATLGPALTSGVGKTERKADEKSYQSLRETLTNHDWAFAYFTPKGIGPTEWSQDEKKLTHIRRRFILLGQTEDGLRAWNVRRAIQGVRTIDGLAESPLWLQSQRQMAGVALAASLFEPNIARLDLYDLPHSLHDGPYFLNAQRYLDTPQLVTLAAERSRVVLYQDAASGWEYPSQVSEKLGWDAKQIQIRKKPD